jgi:hypothetical protein
MRMDARHKDQRFMRIVDGLAVVVLTALALIGAWQGYGEWFVAAVKSHVG